MKDVQQILDRLHLHLNAVDWLEDHAPDNLGCVLGSLRESMENTCSMAEVMLNDQSGNMVTLKEKTLRQRILSAA